MLDKLNVAPYIFISLHGGGHSLAAPHTDRVSVANDVLQRLDGDAYRKGRYLGLCPLQREEADVYLTQCIPIHMHTSYTAPNLRECRRKSLATLSEAM